MNAGKIPGAGNPACKPPVPPASYVISPPDANGFQWPVQSGPPVVNMADGNHVIPPDNSVSQQNQNPTPNVPGIAHWMGGKWYADTSTNTFGPNSGDNGITPPTKVPPGSGGPADDGNFHLFQFQPQALDNPASGYHSGWFLFLQ